MKIWIPLSNLGSKLILRILLHLGDYLLQNAVKKRMKGKENLKNQNEILSGGKKIV